MTVVIPLDALDVGYIGGLRAQFLRGQAGAHLCSSLVENKRVRKVGTKPQQLPLATAGCGKQTVAASAHNVQCALSLFLCLLGTESRTSYILVKYSTAELQSQPMTYPLKVSSEGKRKSPPIVGEWARVHRSPHCQQLPLVLVSSVLFMKRPSSENESALTLPPALAQLIPLDPPHPLISPVEPASLSPQADKLGNAHTNQECSGL